MISYDFRPAHGKNKGENEVRNDRISNRIERKNFCFLLCITSYTSEKGPSIDFLLQKDPIEGQRCVLSEEKKGKIKGKSKEKTTGKTIELTQKTSVFCSI